MEQKNGAVVRHTVGYRRYEGLEAAAALADLYRSLRLFVNSFQSSFKLVERSRDGAKVTKRYLAPATSHQRLVSDPRTAAATRERVAATYATLDPVQLLNAIRTGQQGLVEIADGPVSGEMVAPSAPTLEEFLSGLRTAWREGEVRPTSRPKGKAKRGRRRPDLRTRSWRRRRSRRAGSRRNRGGPHASCLNGFNMNSLEATQLGCCGPCSAGSRRGVGDKAHELVFGATPTGSESAPAALDSVT